MATHPKQSAKPPKSAGLSPLCGIVVRTIAEGNWRSHQVRAAMKTHLSGEPLGAFLSRMESEGWISARRGGWAISTRGAQLLPTVQALPPMRPLERPTTPPRRPGSDHSHIPSVAAGIEQTYKHPI